MGDLDHAVYSASGSKRWLACAGSINLERQAPPQAESKYAEEGTKAHEVVELYLQGYIGKRAPKIPKGVYDKGMIEHGFTAFRWIVDRVTALNDPTVKVLCETRVDLPVSEPDTFGTVDAAIVQLFGRLTVIDYKYGAGIAIDPTENTQLIYYALGLAHLYDFNFEDVELVVIQPRAEVEGGPVRSWVMGIDELESWGTTFEAGIQASKKKGANLVPGEHCRFCKASVICPELSERALKEAQIDFDPIDGSLGLPAVVPSALAIPQLSQILNACDKLEEWIGRVREHAFFVLNKGEKIEGWKLVEKRSIRKWVNDDKVKDLAFKKFGASAMTEPELLSPAQFEKTFKKTSVAENAKEFIDKYVTAKSSGFTLARASDKRPEANSITTEFTAIEDGEEF